MQLPIGLQLTQAARGISRAFDQSLAEAGGSLPVWLVLLAMKTSGVGSQRELMAFDQRLRAGISDEDVAGLRDVLARLAGNAGAVGSPPWAELAG